MMKGIGPPSRSIAAPRSTPGQRSSPLTLVAPFQMRSIAVASVGVRQASLTAVQDAVVILLSAAALYLHMRGSVIVPSTTPSFLSQAFTAAFVASFCFAAEIGPPT